MYLSLKVVIFFCLACPAIACAEGPADRIESSLKSCVDKSEGVTAAMRNCYSEAHSKMDKKLRELNRQLMSRLPPEKQAVLKDAQKKWLAYRKAEEKLSWTLDSNGGGTAQLLDADSLAYELLKTRVLELEKYLQDMNQRN